MTRPGRTAARPAGLLALSAGRGLYGLALLTAPGPLLTAVAGGVTPGGHECAVARVLGARHVAQALIGAAAGRQSMAPGAAVDGLHAASMLAVAAGRPALRRAALADGTIAGILSGIGAVLA